MSYGWFVFVVVACIVLCSGCVLSGALLRAAWARRERESLASSDLCALEESVVLLIEQLRTEVDSGLSDIQVKSEALKTLICEADDRLSLLRSIPPCPSEPSARGNTSIEKIAELASSGMSCGEIARTAGVSPAEVKLMLRLATGGCRGNGRSEPGSARGTRSSIPGVGLES